jgi:hypothetical protein
MGNNNLVIKDLLAELEKTIKLCKEMQDNNSCAMFDEVALKHHAEAYKSVLDLVYQLLDKYTI